MLPHAEAEMRRGEDANDSGRQPQGAIVGQLSLRHLKYSDIPVERPAPGAAGPTAWLVTDFQAGQVLKDGWALKVRVEAAMQSDELKHKLQQGRVLCTSLSRLVWAEWHYPITIK